MKLHTDLPNREFLCADLPQYPVFKALDIKFEQINVTVTAHSHDGRQTRTMEASGRTARGGSLPIRAFFSLLRRFKKGRAVGIRETDGLEVNLWILVFGLSHRRTAGRRRIKKQNRAAEAFNQFLFKGNVLSDTGAVNYAGFGNGPFFNCPFAFVAKGRCLSTRFRYQRIEERVANVLKLRVQAIYAFHKDPLSARRCSSSPSTSGYNQSPKGVATTVYRPQRV